MTDQIIEKVTGDVVDVNEENDIAESHSGSEDLFQRWYKEGYDIYDESYVRWLMVHHPGDIKGEWLTNIAATFKSFTLDQPSVKSQVIVNCDSFLVLYTYGSYVEKKTTKFYHKAKSCILKYLYQPIPVQTKALHHIQIIHISSLILHLASYVVKCI